MDTLCSQAGSYSVLWTLYVVKQVAIVYYGHPITDKQFWRSQASAPISGMIYCIIFLINRSVLASYTAFQDPVINFMLCGSARVMS